jgi:hypothetical protein
MTVDQRENETEKRIRVRDVTAARAENLPEAEKAKSRDQIRRGKRRPDGTGANSLFAQGWNSEAGYIQLWVYLDRREGNSNYSLIAIS